jgi:hypothetical protein
MLSCYRFPTLRLDFSDLMSVQPVMSKTPWSTIDIPTSAGSFWKPYYLLFEAQ